VRGAGWAGCREHARSGGELSSRAQAFLAPRRLGGATWLSPVFSLRGGGGGGGRNFIQRKEEEEEKEEESSFKADAVNEEEEKES